MNVFIRHGNKNCKEATSTQELLSDSFLDFPEITFQQKPNLKISVMKNDEEIISKYASEKITRRIDCLFMMKVNDEMIKNKPSNSLEKELGIFAENDRLIEESLNNQINKMQFKIKQRKINSIYKGSFKRKSRSIKKNKWRF